MPLTVLMADDDEDDRELAREAATSLRMQDKLRFVNDGQELIDYLRHEGPYSSDRDDGGRAPRPAVILLDLNMPRMSGWEALAEIKADHLLRRIPVVVLTTSRRREDVARSYDLGANSFITKPVTLQDLSEVMRVLTAYWLDVVETSDEDDGPSSGEGTEIAPLAVVRATFDACARGDIDEFVRRLRSDVVIEPAIASGRRYVGIESAAAVARMLIAENIRFEPDWNATTVRDHRVLVLGDLVYDGTGSPEEPIRAGWLVEVQDGRITSIRGYPDRWTAITALAGEEPT